MLRQAGQDSLRTTLALGLAAASFILLVGCDSNTAPSPLGTATGQGTIALSERGPEHAVVLVGTNDPSIDVPAVQGAVDRGGVVILKGHFSFDTTVNANVAPDLLPLVLSKTAEVKITKAVTVSGVGDDGDEMTQIDGGTIPFYIDAPNQAVTIRRLRFVRPTSHAVLVFAVHGLEIASTSVEGLTPYRNPLTGAIAGLNGAIGIVTTSGLPNPTNSGKAGNVSGNIVIAHNNFDLEGGTATENVLGVTVFGVGDPTSPAEVRVVGNRITHVTEPAINFRRVVGQAFIEHNVIRTGSIGVPDARSQVIRIANIGSYVVAHNSIDCEWGVGDEEGIGVFSQIQAWHIKHALVVDNDINMVAPPTGTALTDFSAGIGVYGFADSNVVRRNRIRGSARAGIALPFFAQQPSAFPTGNTFLYNRFDHFTPSVADFFVGQTAVDTRIVGSGGFTVAGQLAGTTIVRRGRDH